jgi:hypothetical protein
MATLAIQSLHAAEVVVLFDSDNNQATYTTVDINGLPEGSWETPLLSNSLNSNWNGPAIYGGVVAEGFASSSISLAIDNNNANTNNADAIRWGYNSADGVDDSIFGAFLFDASKDFSLDSTSQFRLNARRTGGRDTGGTTPGIRWVLRDATSGDYYISELNSSTAAMYGGGYVADWGSSTVTESGPETLNWFNYDPSGSGISAIGSSASLDFNASTFDQGGFFYANTRNATGSLIMEFAQFEVVAIPEPGTFALMGLAGLAALIVARRRR